MKLQSVLALSPDQVEELPEPVVRMHELEQENKLLHGEVVELRQQIETLTSQLRPDSGQDTDISLPEDSHLDHEPNTSKKVDVDKVDVVGYSVSLARGCSPLNHS